MWTKERNSWRTEFMVTSRKVPVRRCWLSITSLKHLKKRLRNYVEDSKPTEHGLKILFVQQGRTRIDNPGHEHFGFKDGVSQPGIRGITDPDDPIANPNQGHPGQDLLWPGEFVLGYPQQIPKAAEGVDGPNPNPGPISGPADDTLM